MPMRLQKFLADAGVASRRAGEQLILAGKVTVNGAVTTQLGTKVDPTHDVMRVEGRPVQTRRKLYIAVHKPRGYICTRSDEHSRRRIGELLPKEWAHLYPVGRLDRDSEGLIFLTNDGEFALHLTHPRYGMHKHYMALVAGRVEPAMLRRFESGVEHLGETLRAVKAWLHEANNTHSLVEVELGEGKNREVRRLFESQGLTVERLTRFQIGPIKLGELPAGRWRALTAAEIKSLLP